MKNVIVINSYKSDSYAKNLYDDVVQLTLTKKGYDKDITINDPTKCLYCEETYVSYNDDVRKWVVNRPEKVMNCVYDKNGDLVGDIMLFEYDRENPFEVVREHEFAPIKNATGVDSVESAQALLEQNGYEL